MKKVLSIISLMLGVGLLTQQVQAADQKLGGQIYSPKLNVICDKKTKICVDDMGVSVAITKLYFGDKAEAQLMKNIGDIQTFDASTITMSNGLTCKAKEKKCFTGKWSDKVDQKATKILYAN
jgi:hypothetical protein